MVKLSKLISKVRMKLSMGYKKPRIYSFLRKLRNENLDHIFCEICKIDLQQRYCQENWWILHLREWQSSSSQSNMSGIGPRNTSGLGYIRPQWLRFPMIKYYFQPKPSERIALFWKKTMMVAQFWVIAATKTKFNKQLLMIAIGISSFLSLARTRKVNWPSLHF